MDWRNKKQYADHWESLNPKLRAWEFLRRSREYQALWEAESAKAKLPDGRYCVDWWMAGYEKTPEGGMILAADDPNLALSATVDIQARWRIINLVPPWQDKPSQLFFTENMQHPLKCELDLTMPLDPQIEKLRKVAKQYQRLHHPRPKHKPKHKPTGNHAEYLRILDAVADGLKPAELAKVLYPKEENSHSVDYRVTKKIDGHIKTAKRISNHGYIQLVKPHNW